MEGMENTLCNKLYSPMQNDRTFCTNLSTLTQTTSGGSRPSDKEEGLVIQTLSWGGAVSKKRFFLPFGPQFGLKIRRGRPSPGAATENFPF